MSFQSLKVDELKDVADFFVVDVEAADEEHGPTKKELLAALAAGDEPVTWEQYKDIYLVAKQSDNTAAEPENATDADAHAEAAEAVAAEPRDASNDVLIKYERKNPTYEVVGYTFTPKHPFASVPPEVAEYLVRNVEGFRLAMPSEVTDYYN
jgi:hypothetical protein